MSLPQQPTKPETDSFVIGDVEVFPATAAERSFFAENDDETFLFVPANLSPVAQHAEAVRAISEKGVLTI